MTASSTGYPLTEQVRELAESVEGLSLDLVQGEVFMVYPGLGVYLVLPKHGDSTGQLTLCCSMGGSIGRSGVRGGDVYEAGDDVLYARHKTNLQPFGTYNITYIGYVLSAAPPDFMATAQGYPGANIHGETLDYFIQTVTTAFASTKQLEGTLHDISHGMPNDVFAGDFVKYGPLFSFLSVCATKSSIGASPMAMVEAFAFHDKLRISARSLEERSLSVESGREPDEQAMMYYKRLAMTEREGLGIVGDGGAPFTENDDGDYELTEEEQLGVFRHTALAGPIADGEVDAVVTPVESDAPHTKEGLPPRGVVSVRKTYDGRHETRAAGGIDHVKSLYIPVPEQIAPHDAEAFASEPEAQEAYEREVADALARGFPPFSGTLESEEFDADTEKNRNSISKARPDHWRTMTREELAEEFPGMDVEDAPKKLEPLAPGKPFYDEPPYQDVPDPVTDMQRRLYALESIIRQQPDGSIIISDGHGAEIRMFRGRMSIGAATDLLFQPGRDCIELVPRRKVINAGEELQLVSNEGKVRIKAETDVDVLAGNGDEGRVLIENRADTGVEDDRGGVVIKSKTKLSMMGEDMYIGLIPPESGGDSTVGLSRRQSGSIFIDSRGGNLGLQGEVMHARFKSGIALSQSNALLAMTGGILTGIANATQFATGPFTIGTTKEVGATLAWMDDRGFTQELVSAPGNPFLQVDGTVIGTGSATFNGTLRGKVVNGKHGAFGNASKTSGLYAKDINFPSATIDPFSINGITALSGLYAASVPGDLNDKALKSSHFQYDQPGDVDQGACEIQLLRWQSMLMYGGEAQTWEQKPVKDSDGDDTYAYPGYGPDGTPLDAGKVGRKPFNEYIVNK